MLIGYARVSTLDQTLALQQDALTAAGCEHLYTDTVSGSVTDRPGLSLALSHLRPGDTLVVWRLDRLGCSLPHLIETVRQLQERGVGFRSLQEQIDTTTSGGKLVFHVFGAPQSLSGISSGSGPTQAGQLPELEVGCLVGPRR
jgi:DNA invertase Pin-like site-specific DNA recombinase